MISTFDQFFSPLDLLTHKKWFVSIWKMGFIVSWYTTPSISWVCYFRPFSLNWCNLVQGETHKSGSSYETLFVVPIYDEPEVVICLMPKPEKLIFCHNVFPFFTSSHYLIAYTSSALRLHVTSYLWACSCALKLELVIIIYDMMLIFQVIIWCWIKWVS